jgi:hypothetical protein
VPGYQRTQPRSRSGTKCHCGISRNCQENGGGKRTERGICRICGRVSSPRPQREADDAHQGRNDQRRKHMKRHVIRQHPTEREQREKPEQCGQHCTREARWVRFFRGGRPPSALCVGRLADRAATDPVIRSPTSRRKDLAMTDIFPETLMLAASLAIWAGIAWLLIERIG